MKTLHAIYNEDFEITHCEFHEVGQAPANSTTVLPSGHVRPIFDPATQTISEGATLEEIEAHQADLIAICKEAARLKLLKTDWYFARLADTGKPVPQEVIDERAQIRQDCEDHINQILNP